MEELTIQTSERFKLSARKIKTIEAFEIRMTICKDANSMVISHENARTLGEWLIKSSEEQ